MSKIDVYDLTGKKSGQTETSDAIFAVEPNIKLIRQAAIAQLDNQRQSNAHTKTRGEVAGGGRKPWRQKGTGRARAGSSRSPVWIGGGVVFGPRNDRNYSQMLNRKMRRKALFMALSLKAKDNKFIIVKDLTVKEPKTRQAVELLAKLPVSDGSVLVVLPESEPTLQVAMANLPYAKTTHVSGLSLLDVMRFDYVLTTKDGLKSIEALFGINNEEKDEEKEEKAAKTVAKPAKTTRSAAKES